jgi:exopolyphosphatase/guanosine-5'-triphosphate,3'-diphosphate pyrophosphatase
VVDCGSNSTRLLLATVSDGRVRDPRRHAIITRLGRDVDSTGRLSNAAIDRVTRVIGDYAAQWRAEGVKDAAVFATSAVRDAANAAHLVRAVEMTTGITPIVLSGVDEAELTFAGGIADMPGRRVVCDIGGGSTELIAGRGRPEHRVSLQLGSVRLRERHLHHDPPAVDEYAALIADVDAVLATQSQVYAAERDAPLVAVAGTATTLGAVAARVGPDAVDRIDNMVLTVADLAQVIECLAWIPAQRRLLEPAIVPGREDVVVAGGLILARVLDRFGFPAVQVRVADVLDGVAVRLAAGEWPRAENRGAVGHV